VHEQLITAAAEFCGHVRVDISCRSLRALERGGASEEGQEAAYHSALAAGMESPEDYMEVCLARLDALRRKGSDHMEGLRAAFQAATELMQVGTTLRKFVLLQYPPLTPLVAPLELFTLPKLKTVTNGRHPSHIMRGRERGYLMSARRSLGLVLGSCKLRTL